MSTYQLIGPFSQLLDLADLPVRGSIRDEELTIIQDGGIILQGEKVFKTGKYQAIKGIANDLKADIFEIEAPNVCVPGFVDMHTHICFAGTRANDYAMRNAGMTYLAIAQAGGGIWDTVTSTRGATSEQLIQGVLHRTLRHLRHGITTIEVKSGYGLSVDEELKMLKAIQLANSNTPADLISTCLAAHILPKDFNGNHQAYLTEISNHLFPILIEENLTNRVDAFVEHEAFSPSVITPYLKHAKNLGFDITIHADQFHTGGSAIAVDLGAISADHLEATTQLEIEMLARSKVIATALPGASLGLGCNFAPARSLLDAGGALAIASDWNPGSAPMGNLLTQATILGTFQKLTNAELLAGITYRAANALNLHDRGRLKPGAVADFVLFPTDNYQEIFYHQGQMIPNRVWKNGRLLDF